MRLLVIKLSKVIKVYWINRKRIEGIGKKEHYIL